MGLPGAVYKTNVPMSARRIIALFGVYGLLAFPLFYFVYKFGDPIHIAHDFFSYYHLYNNWDWSHVNAPFNMRLVSSAGVFVLHKTGLYFETASAFDQYLSYGIDKRVYFSALLFNYLCVAATCVVIFLTARRHFGNALLAFVAGLLYLLGFGTLFYELMPLTDAFSVLLFAGLLYFYLRRSYLVIAALLLAVLQREYLLLATGLMALVDYFFTRQKYYLHVFIAGACCFAVYYILRKTVFYTPHFDFQTSPGELLKGFLNFDFPLASFARQTLINLNLFILYLLLLAWKRSQKMPIDRQGLMRLLFLLAQVIAISFAASIGNNAGRCFYMLAPLLIFEMAREGRFLTENTVAS